MDKLYENQFNNKSVDVDVDERFLRIFRGRAIKNIAIGFMFTYLLLISYGYSTYYQH